MKCNLPSVLLLCMSMMGFIRVSAQSTPSMDAGMGYQALLRDAEGQPLSAEEGTLVVEVLDPLDSALYVDSIPVVTDAYGMLYLMVGGGPQWTALPWHLSLQLRATWFGPMGSVPLGAQVIAEAPKARYSGNGWFFQGPEDLRLVIDADTVRLHADSLVVIGNTREGDTLLTEVVRLQAQRDVIFSARDDVSAFADDDVKLNAGSDVWLDAMDDVRLDALDDVRANAANELELVGLRRTNLGTAEGLLPAADTTVVMAKGPLHIGIPVGVVLTGTPQDTIYLAEVLRMGGQDIQVTGPTTFDRPVTGVDGTEPDHFVTLAQLQIMMSQLQQMVLQAVASGAPSAPLEGEEE